MLTISYQYLGEKIHPAASQVTKKKKLTLNWKQNITVGEILYLVCNLDIRDKLLPRDEKIWRSYGLTLLELTVLAAAGIGFWVAIDRIRRGECEAAIASIIIIPLLVNLRANFQGEVGMRVVDNDDRKLNPY